MIESKQFANLVDRIRVYKIQRWVEETRDRIEQTHLNILDAKMEKMIETRATGRREPCKNMTDCWDKQNANFCKLTGTEIWVWQRSYDGLSTLRWRQCREHLSQWSDADRCVQQETYREAVIHIVECLHTAVATPLMMSVQTNLMWPVRSSLWKMFAIASEWCDALNQIVEHSLRPERK